MRYSKIRRGYNVENQFHTYIHTFTDFFLVVKSSCFQVRLSMCQLFHFLEIYSNILWKFHLSFLICYMMIIAPTLLIADGILKMNSYKMFSTVAHKCSTPQNQFLIWMSIYAIFNISIWILKALRINSKRHFQCNIVC